MKKTPRYYAKELLTAVLKNPSDCELLITRFWQQMLINKYFGWRRRILQEIDDLWYELTEQTKVIVTTSRELSASEKQIIIKQIKTSLPNDCYIDWQLKPHLLGGVIITINGERYDLSFKGQLDKLYFKLSQ